MAETGDSFRQRMVLIKFMQSALAMAEAAVWTDTPDEIRESCADLTDSVRAMHDLLGPKA